MNKHSFVFRLQHQFLRDICNYFTQVTPTNGTGKQIAQVIYNALEKISLNDRVKVIGTDGTATMMGKKSGYIASLETKLGRPLQWIVSLLHLNELPLRHIFQ